MLSVLTSTACYRCQKETKSLAYCLRWAGLYKGPAELLTGTESAGGHGHLPGELHVLVSCGCLQVSIDAALVSGA